MTKIAIIGGRGVGIEAKQLIDAAEKQRGIEIVGCGMEVNQVNINGVLWEEIKQPKRNSGRGMSKYIALTGMMASIAYPTANNYQRQLPPINLVEEFKLIQEKKSKLSKWERDQVVIMFNKKYKLVSNDK